MAVPTSTDDKLGSSTTKPGTPTGLGDDRWMVPFLDIGLPKGRSLATRGDGLFPYPLFGDGYVLPKEEIEDEVDLISDSNQSGH